MEMKSKNHRYLYPASLVGMVIFWGCIGDDVVFDTVDPVIKITNPIDSIEINSTYQFEYSYLNNVGKEEQITVDWSSTNDLVISVTATGLATALAPGTCDLIVSANVQGAGILSDSNRIAVGSKTVTSNSERKGSLRSTSSYTLRGDFVLKEEGSALKLEFSSNYSASSNLPGLYVYLTNNPSTTNGALELGKVTVFNGAHSYAIPPSVKLNDYRYLLYFCKPFNVKVGDGEFSN